jgi:cytochrome c peroxidase
MPNPVEQNIDRQGVCRHVASSKYAKLYKLVWGVDIDCSDTTVTISAPDMDPSVNPFADPLFFPERAFDISFKRLMLAVCAWQASDDLNSFSSKRDIALAADADGKFHLDGFTAQENLGHDLFYNRLPVPFIPEGGFNVRPFPDLPITNCSFCHMSGPSNVAPGELGTDPEERYTDDAYHNIGTPPNPEIPGYPVPNAGLAGHTGIAAHSGFHKTPTLRNVDKRKGKGFIKAYTHNGWFKSMESIVHFYNTAFIGNPANGKTLCPEGTTEKNALKLSCWPAPEQPGGPGIPAPPIPILLGNLGLTPEQEAAIVAYLKTLTDTYTPKAPKPYK